MRNLAKKLRIGHRRGNRDMLSEELPIGKGYRITVWAWNHST